MKSEGKKQYRISAVLYGFFSEISEAEVLHLGVLVDAVLGALPADPGLLHATERGLRAALGGRQRK